MEGSLGGRTVNRKATDTVVYYATSLQTRSFKCLFTWQWLLQYLAAVITFEIHRGATFLAVFLVNMKLYTWLDVLGFRLQTHWHCHLSVQTLE